MNADIARAIVRCHSESVGRGPTKAVSFFHGNLVVVVLEETMTRSERSLVAGGRGAVVHATRQELQRMMEPQLVAAIESLTGCAVVAFLSDNHVDPDVAVELFVLDQPVPVSHAAPAPLG